MIVDTSFILDVLDDIDEAVEMERRLEAEGVPLVIPSMVVLERYLGVGKSDATIAATAIERNEPVLAGDSHFKSIPGVEVAVLLLRVRLFTVLNVASCRSARPSRTAASTIDRQS